MKKGITPLKKYNPYHCTTRQRAIEAVRRLISDNPDLLFCREMDTCFEMNDSKQVAPLVVKILAQYGYMKFEDLGYYAQKSAVPRWWQDRQGKLFEGVGEQKADQGRGAESCLW